MILYIDSNNKIYGYNSYVESDEFNTDAVQYDGEFSFEQGENKEGFTKVFKWDGEKPILEYEPTVESEHALTQLVRIEQAVNLKNEDIANAAVDSFTLELMEEGVL